MLKRTHRSDSPDEFNRNSGAERIALGMTLSIACSHPDAAVNREARAKAEGSQVGHEPRSTAEVGPGRNTNPMDLTTSPSSSFSRSLSSSSKSRSKKRRGSGSSGGPDGSQYSERARRSLTISLHGSSDSGSDCRRGRGSSGDSESAYVGERAPEMVWLDDEGGLEAMAYEARSKAQAGKNRTLESRAIMEDGRGQAKNSVQATRTTSNQVMRPLVGVVIHAQTRKTHDEGKSFGPRFDEKERYKAKEQPRPSSSKLPVNLDDLPTMDFRETNLDPFFGLTIPRESPPREAGHTKRADHGK